jgi:hypothetical protein
MKFTSSLAKILTDLQHTKKLLVLNQSFALHSGERRRVERLESKIADSATSLPVDYPFTPSSGAQEL